MGASMTEKHYGKRNGDDPSRAARLANDAYLTLAVRLIVPVLGTMILFFMVRLVDNMDQGLKQINQNVTEIAVYQRDIAKNASAIIEVERVNSRQWQQIADHNQ